MNKFLLATLAVLPSLSLFADAPTPKQGNFMPTLVMIGVALVFFYFILLRPEQKRRKAAESMRNSMKKGDRVTAMGLVGTVNKVQNDTVILNMYDGTKVEVLKAAITEVQPNTSSEKEETKASE